MTKLKVGLRPLVSKINLPTVLKTAILPGESMERLFMATQAGEIFYLGDGCIKTFLDIRPQIIKLGATRGGYDERGLLGLAFHPDFSNNGLFYLHYSAAGTQGPGALSERFKPDSCHPETLHLKWMNRETHYDHIDTVEEWMLQTDSPPRKRRTLLNLRRPFFNHNGVNSLNFSPESGRLILTTGDGGAGYDPFNLSQDDLEIAGKIIEIDVNKSVSIPHLPAATRFDELPGLLQETLTVMAKGVRNIPGISFQALHHSYIKYAGNVGQDLAESIFSFVQYKPVPVSRLVQASRLNDTEKEEITNLGWRGWEGPIPASTIKDCSENPSLDENILAYYHEAVNLSTSRLQPLTWYFHRDSRPDKFEGTALTGVQPYMGRAIPHLSGSVVFTDLLRNQESQAPARGVIAYSRIRPDGGPNEYSVIEIDDPFGSQSAYFVSLGANSNQTRLFLGVYGSMKVTDCNQGMIYEIVSV
ncbi:PQQ-dependent sugar dehydrogenase [Peribacillus kribbensis]|uniref:PQQ-dependent sugar dehydrogenase n=1 Tax=Peribacillus kribbensis TaxID=356658 RepID=UPI000411A0A6|nr:PQQ-dependent sugar dehydrogenase [Peribacillus kribbensis]